ncbi:MAG TPA: hypothetical protein VFV87_19390 [Pirellulaceae bacterium]|nr:hypothetical protein [Pirellulaceae bacterium]
MARLGQPPLPRIGPLYADADATELITFPELDPNGAQPGMRYWGTWNSSWGVRPDWPSGSRRVFFYLKPCPALEPLLKAIPELGVASIVYVPELPHERVKAMTGSGALVLRGPADLRHVLQSCDLAVLHGTHGALTEALLAGTPTLNFPLNLEQLLHSPPDKHPSSLCIEPPPSSVKHFLRPHHHFAAPRPGRSLSFAACLRTVGFP